MNQRDIVGGELGRRAALASIAGVGMSTILPAGVAARPLEEFEEEGDLPSITLTPRPDDAETSGTVSLSGTWDFRTDTSDEPPLEEEWGSEPVPGQWRWGDVLEDESDWYSPDSEYGWYRREFDVPERWDDGRMKLRFDAVYSQARVWLNGTEIGDHVGGYTPFEFDVTDDVHSEENELIVAVSHESIADDIAWQNVTGGITRDVTLVCVPACHLSRFHLETDVEDDGDRAIVRTLATVANDGNDTIEDATLRVQVTDPDGDDAGSLERDLEAIDAGEEVAETLEIALEEPATWNPDQPRLYEVECELEAGGDGQRVSDRVGIRELEIDGNQLLLNGESVTLRGVNWEEVHIPEHGHAIPADATRRDAEVLREANVNFVRTAHHPTSEAFLEACDELGIVVEVEAPHMFVGRGRPDPDYDLVVQQTLEMVERDRSRTSVCIWSIANESGWYDAFEDAAQLVQTADPTRPTIFHHDVYSEDHPWHEYVDIASHHYPAKRAGSTVEEFDGLELPVMFGEYAHLYCYNDQELVTDPGLRDEWVRLFDTIWNQCRSVDACIGAAIWAGGDHLEQWGQYLWGMLDRYRRPRPEYWHVKQVYSPVQLVSNEWVDEETVRLELENRHEFVNLNERLAEWHDGEEITELELDVEPGETGEVTVETGPSDEPVLRIIHPDGYTITEFAFPREETTGERSSPGRSGEAGSIFESGGEVRAETPGHSLTVDADGKMTIGSNHEDVIVVDGPDLVLTPTQPGDGIEYTELIDHRLEDREVTDVRIVEDNSAIAIDVAYAEAEGEFVLRPLGTEIEIEYDFELLEERSTREVGVVFPVAPEHETLSWTREGYWSVYPGDHIGRLEGTASAFPDGNRPEEDAIRLGTAEEWRHEATARGSNDFRSTKRDVRLAELLDGDRGVAVVSEGDQHVRSQIREDAVDFLILDRSITGATPGWMDRYSVLDQDPVLETGTRVEGSATIRLVGSRSNR